MLHTLLNRLPGGTQTKVFIGTTTILGLSYYSFFHLFPKKKAGHNAFDVDKPEAVQASMDKASDKRLAITLENSKKST